MTTVNAPSSIASSPGRPDPLAHPLRETPAREPIPGKPDPVNTAVLNEPVLNVANIQGNILSGFNKDHQILLFLKITEVHAAKIWLKTQIPYIATAVEVIAFNRLFKATKERRRTEGAVKATWVNIAFTYTGLHQLSSDATQFTDAAFKQGLAKRAALLGDPVDTHHNPANWLVGGPHNPQVDILLLVAADERADMLAECDRIGKSITAFVTPEGQGAVSGVEIVFTEEGANLPPPLSGHEHFGFLDGVSQPGVRGLVSPNKSDVLTLRQNPAKRDQTASGKIISGQGKPGQDLLWPGEFVFGYPTQNPIANEARYDGPNATPGPDSLTGLMPGEAPIPARRTGPEWAQDGSFLVFRRLRQNVGAFHTFLQDTARQHNIPDTNNASGARLVGARLVGRWPSGAPVEREPDRENPPMGDDDCANNHFEFGAAGNPIPALAPGQPGYSKSNCVDATLPQGARDDLGLRCPFSGHIRKAYPRDDEAIIRAGSDPGQARTFLNESNTQTHRLLRRGIPYGPVSRSTPDAPIYDNADRGLHFLAYQTSIEYQFEFVTRFWVNNAQFKEPFGIDTTAPNLRGGHDPIIGQNNTPGENRVREFTLTFPDPVMPDGQKAVRVSTQDFIQETGITDWVIPTGGGYFFAPSLSALENHLT